MEIYILFLCQRAKVFPTTTTLLFFLFANELNVQPAHACISSPKDIICLYNVAHIFSYNTTLTAGGSGGYSRLVSWQNKLYTINTKHTGPFRLYYNILIFLSNLIMQSISIFLRPFAISASAGGAVGYEKFDMKRCRAYMIYGAAKARASGVPCCALV